MPQQEADEYFDIVKPNNKVTGEIKSRAETHRDGSWHRAAHIWIVDSGGNVLLQKRSKHKLQHPGVWDLAVGGHVEAGALPVDAAVRECAEELGLNVKAYELQYLFDVNHEDFIDGWQNPHREIVSVYLLRKDVSPERLHLQAEEVEAVAFVPIRDFERDLKANTKKYYPHPEEYNRILPVLDAARSE